MASKGEPIGIAQPMGQMRKTGLPNIGKFSAANQKKLTPIPKIDAMNPHINEDYEPCHAPMS